MSFIRLTALLSLLFLSGYNWWFSLVTGLNIVAITGKFIICYMLIVTYQIVCGKRKLSYLQWVVLAMYMYMLYTALLSVSDMEGLRIDNVYAHFSITLLWYYFTLDDGFIPLIEQKQNFLKKCYFLFLIMPVIVSCSCAGTRFWYSYRLASTIYVNKFGLSDFNVQYQALGDYMTLFFFMVIRFFDSFYKKCVMLLLTFASLFVIGTQAAFVSLIFATIGLALIDIIIGSRIDIKKFFAVVLMITTFLCGLFLFVSSNKYVVEGNVIYQLFLKPSKSDSIASRQSFETENKTTRKNRVMFGDYGFEIKKGISGTYSHSIVDLLDQYGVIIISCYVGLYVLSLFFAFKKFIVSQGSIFRIPAFSVLLFALPMILFIRSSQMRWLFFPLGMGLNCIDNFYSEN